MKSTNLCWSSKEVAISGACLLLLLCKLSPLVAQDQQQTEKPIAELAPSSAIEIFDNPKTVDPAILMPPQLAAKVTVKIEGEPLKNVLNWIRRESSMNVLVDYRALASAKLLDTDPVFDELNDEPLYLLLSRLDTLGLGWYMQDDAMQITSRAEALTHDTTVQYNLGDLFDAGYLPKDLVRTIIQCAGGVWDGENTGGTAVLLGDVVFIRQTAAIHREVAGLLNAIRKHGRRTFTLDAPQHDAVRAAAVKTVTVDFQETPLIVAIQDLSRQVQISIRLDRAALAESSVRERTPVSLKLADQKLNAVLRSLLSNMGLTWYLRDNVLWITTFRGAQQQRKTAVYDVRDLCRDMDESNAMKETILKQANTQWRTANDSSGAIETPKPGVLVVRHTEAMLDEILKLLEDYRAALRASKVRTVRTPDVDPTEVITGYYKLPTPMSEDLRKTLPKLILPNSWNGPGGPDAIGFIWEISADANGGQVQNQANRTDSKGVAAGNTILVIRQTRVAHQAIGKLIQTLLKSQTVDVEATIDTSKKAKSPPGSFGTGLIPSGSK